jgi:nucleotide-binding universal stress UspA family protein
MNVVDSEAAWEMLAGDGVGFLKKETSRQSYDVLVQLMKCMAIDMMDAFEELSDQVQVESKTLVAEGSPVAEICAESLSHDLVVIGHRPKQLHGRSIGRKLISFASFAEHLANECPRPLLVIQDECPAWRKLLIAVSTDHINECYIDSCLKVANELSVQPELFVIRIGESEESSNHLVEDLQETLPALREITIHTRVMSHRVRNEDDTLSLIMDATSLENEVPADVLVVIPTRSTGGERLTIFGNTADTFIADLKAPAIMLWPEEFVATQKSPKSTCADEIA